MVVVVLVAAPPGLRGHLTRWMVEIHAGVFVGSPSQRVRDQFWLTLTQRIGDGHAVMVEPVSSEQGWTVRTAGRDRWTPVDFDGVLLMARPDGAVNVTATPT
ncbi:type I-E CRISPR-associated endoribonuclease Cas2e [Parenemella sanctibonifatiensis]|uniref:Type I-E CRISPR-associated endoribonuclease Cas2 n=1 Tax=Parenemella sanctibonifatiensis TaxID=2016505 RepID=A0A255ECY0_9ACTN|nr:type I-E CRISPR-associated endoribonuclease Cas2e [Parenemella sanctibonifatiensis]OYN89419.1 type I-E CRISPR-associated endoribonuclease Cas2 [Parenemella sanctibonifatiensis]